MLQYLLYLDAEEDKKLFCELYESYKDRMYYAAYDILHNESDAEDMVHETFLALIHNFEKIKGNSCHKTWNYIVTIIRNKSINLYHKKKRQPLLEESWEDREVFSEHLEEKILAAEQRDLFLVLLGEMKEPYRSVLTLQYYHELNYEEIGNLLQKTTDNI